MSVRQIAQALGISPSAVSLALRGSPKVSPATRRKVEKAAKRFGYRPSARVAELMAGVRATREGRYEGCLGVISLYDQARPWEKSEHFGRIYAAMQQRAEALGYRLEPLWLRAPGMTYRRFCAILDARGIQGLLSFGSPKLDDRFPAELDHYAIVTLGLGIETPLHRVTSHFYNDTTLVLNKVAALGYRRPGLIIGRYEEVRTAYALGAYLGWCERQRSGEPPIPVLRLDWADERPFRTWLEQNRPDVIVVVLVANAVPELAQLLKRSNVVVPRDLGVAVITHFLEGTGFSGLQQNQAVMGAWAVEQVIARIMNRDFGIPANPRIEMVEGCWVDGGSL